MPWSDRALHLDPVYIGAHHVARIFFVGAGDAVHGQARGWQNQPAGRATVPEAPRAPLDE